MLQKRRGFSISFIILSTAFVCFIQQAAIAADDPEVVMETPKNIPAGGFYWDKESSTLFCNGKEIGHSEADKEKYRLHSYPRFLSYDNGGRVSLFYEGAVSWQAIRDLSRSIKIVPDRSFNVINPYLAHDRTTTFYISRDRAGPLPNASYHVFSFFPLAGNPPVETLTVLPDSRYIKSTRLVYYDGQPIEGADPKTFGTLSQNFPSITTRVYNLTMEDYENIEEYNGIAADEKHVFRGNQIVSEIPAGKAYRLLSRFFIVTEEGVFFTGKYKLKKMDGVDPVNFAMLGKYHAGDRHSVFFISYKINADPLSFKEIEGYYGKDNNGVYYAGSLIKDADPKTFTIIGKGYAKDRRNVYLKGALIGQADPDGFVLYMLTEKDKKNLLNSHYMTDEDFYFAHDGKRVYFGIKTVDKADPKTFQPYKYWIEYLDSEKKRVDVLYEKGKIRY